MLRSNVFVLLTCCAFAAADAGCSNDQAVDVGECAESSSDKLSVLMNRNVLIESITHDKKDTDTEGHNELDKATLRAELANMKTAALIKRAGGLDLDEDAWEDVKVALIELIVGHEGASEKVKGSCSVQAYCGSGNNLKSKSGPQGPYTEGGWTNTAGCIDTFITTPGCFFEVATGQDGQGNRYTYKESASMRTGPGWDKVRSIRVYEASAAEKAKAAASAAMGVVAADVFSGSCCQEMCWIWGDPHFTTFDGKQTVFMNKDWNHYWAVKSADVQIQGIATGGVSRTKCIAAGGAFLGGKVLEACYSNGVYKVLFDGVEVLTENGAAHSAPGVQLYVNSGSSFMPTKQDLGELGENQKAVLSKVLARWRHNRVYTFQLPGNVDISIVQHDSTEVLIKMPPQAGQDGWCGNFNGVKDDDPSQGSSQHPQPVSASDDLFKHFGGADKVISLLLKDEPASDLEACPNVTLARAEQACSHIADLPLQRACMDDICATNDVDFGEDAAGNMELLGVLQGKDIPVFEGHGHCRDQKGSAFSSVEAKTVVTKQHCVQLLRKVGVFQGVRGAEFTDDLKCKILVDAKPMIDLTPHKIPGGWGAPLPNDGNAMITGSSHESGIYCWRVL